MIRVFILILLAGHSLFAQPLADTTVQTAIANTIRLYSQSIKGQTALYNGSQYKEPAESDNGHPFLGEDDWQFGSIVYHNQFYDNVPLLYDLTKDEIITEYYYNGNEMILVKEAVTKFEINDRIFVNIAHASLPKNGYYQLLYDGPSTVLVRRQKKIRETISFHALEVFFDERNRFFIYKNGVYFPIRNKSAILKILGDKKSALKKFVKTNKARFKTDFESALKLTAAHYDALNRPE